MFWYITRPKRSSVWKVMAETPNLGSLTAPGTRKWLQAPRPVCYQVGFWLIKSLLTHWRYQKPTWANGLPSGGPNNAWLKIFIPFWSLKWYFEMGFECWGVVWWNWWPECEGFCCWLTEIRVWRLNWLIGAWFCSWKWTLEWVFWLGCFEYKIEGWLGVGYE